MGIGILGVLIAHTFELGNIPHMDLLTKFICIIPRIVFTEGFLFLSGFGLYYSFSKNANIREFYFKRLRRLIIPFVILSSWYYIFQDFIETYDPISFILHISSLAFWFDGNYNGMWYVAISIMLYILFPLIYKAILTNRGGKVALLIILTILLIILIKYFLPTYYSRISIGIDKIPIFILGVYAGQISFLNKTKEGLILLSVVVSVWILSFEVKNLYQYGVAINGMAEKIVYMSILCILISQCENWHLIQWINKCLRWFGKYSLELYVLHLLLYCFISSNIFGVITPLFKVCFMNICAILLCVPFHQICNVITNLFDIRFIKK